MKERPAPEPETIPETPTQTPTPEKPPEKQPTITPKPNRTANPRRLCPSQTLPVPPP